MPFAKISYSTLNVSIGNTTYRLFSNDVSRGNHRSLRVHGSPLRASNHVYHATITEESSIKQEVVVKLATSQEELVWMQREAGLYEKELKSLCGNVVPNYYGFYQRQPDSEVIGCIILEKLDLVPPPADVIEFSRQCLLGICKLHQVGVYHGGLRGTRDVLSTLGGPRIVDFSNAFRHECVGCRPQLITSGGVAPDNYGCLELAQAENIYGCLETFEGIEHRKHEEAREVRMQMNLAGRWLNQGPAGQAFSQVKAIVDISHR